MKSLIEIHVLQNFAPSNLNRDDTGAPKDALFGGTRRARVSSQCQKRAVRQFFIEKKDQGFFSSDELAVRTKRVYSEIVNRLADRHDRDEALEKAKIALSYVKLKPSDDDKSQYLLFLGQREIQALADTIHEEWEAIVATTDDEDDKKKKNKKAAATGAPKEVLKRIANIFDGGKAVDVALFGRMLADMPEKNQDAACQVAHAISTHAVEREFDFYTAVDDLKPEDSSGADMIGTIEFNSACYYRYAVVDWSKLIDNLQNDEALALKGLQAFLEAFVVAEPTGKQNTFAAHNPTEFIAVSVRRDTAPRSLANAFETAIRIQRDESLTGRSAQQLVNKAISLQTAYGGEESTFVLNLTSANLDGYGAPVSDLKSLLEQTLECVQE